MRIDGWTCPHGHHVPGTQISRCPDCGAANRARLPRPPTAAQRKAATDITTLLLVGVGLWLLGGAVIGLSWPQRPADELLLVALLPGLLCAGVGQVLLIIGGVRLALRAERRGA